MRAVRSGKPVLPGFGLTLGFTVTYLGLVVLIPLSTIFVKSAGLGWSGLWAAATTPRVLASYRLSLVASLAAALISALFGLVVAWVLARYQFPGRRFVDAFVDLPFALPTAVAGLTLTTLYAPSGWIGSLLAPLGVKVAFTPLGIVLALTFIGLPFVVRTLQPVLEDLEIEAEEAAASLGASRWHTFRRVLLPAIRPALLTGFTLAFARAVGEYGSVVFISGNMPLRTEIAPLLIMTKLEQFDYAGAAAIAVVLLLASFALLVTINLQAIGRRRAASARGTT
jgi:sulfate transport system permease protein